ncbi:MAG: hypothetical protein LBD21_10270 [Tannerellaceae bacterium]|jgi:hypothetical protein|nr:hypothetical protein [Tannerellaceae bacterium]
MNRILPTLIATAFAAVAAQAQMTVGSDSRPERAALLELKTQEPANPPSTNDPANVTSNRGGLMLPRVMLIDTATLEPFIAVNNPDWIDNQRTKIKETHAGLTVYNLTSSSMFTPGYYTWNGSRWDDTRQFTYGANEGLIIIDDSLHIGGSITKDVTVNTNGHAVNFSGSAPLHLNMPVTLSDSLIYTYGKPGEGKIMIADENGVGTWQNNNALKTAPSVMMSQNGVTLTSSNWNNYVGTGTFITLPPGEWYVMIAMFVQMDGKLAALSPTSKLDNCMWIRSTMIREGDTEAKDEYYIGNKAVSGRVYSGKNLVTGLIVMRNRTNAPIRFEYWAGNVRDIERKEISDNKIRLPDVGGRSFGENTIIVISKQH